jgi:hypothetical protein
LWAESGTRWNASLPWKGPAYSILCVLVHPTTTQLKLGVHEIGLGFAMYRDFFVRARVLDFMNERYMGAARGHAAYKLPAGRVPSRGACREFLQLGWWIPSEYLEYSYRTPSQSLSSTYPTPIRHLSDIYPIECKWLKITRLRWRRHTSSEAVGARYWVEWWCLEFGHRGLCACLGWASMLGQEGGGMRESRGARRGSSLSPVEYDTDAW